MSALFTTLTTDTDPIDKTWANEIILAYSERRQILNQSAIDPLVGEENAQDKTLWLAMQSWMETHCTSFIDHINGSLNEGSAAFLYFTLATWRAASGLNADGFSRYDGGVLIGHGNIVGGGNSDDRDIVNFQELQAGFSALKWTKFNPTGTYHAYGYNMFDTANVTFAGDDECGAALDEFVAEWPPNADISDHATNPIYSVSSSFEWDDQGFWYVRGKRTNAMAMESDFPTFLPTIASVYVKGVSGEDFENSGYGIGIYTHLEDLEESSAAARTGTVRAWTVGTSPTLAVPLTCPPPNGSNSYLANTEWILKWNFTNSN